MKAPQNIGNEVHQEVLRVLSRSLFSSLLISSTLSIVLTFALWNKVNHTFLITWMITLNLTFFLRLHYFYSFRSTTLSSEQQDVDKRLFLFRLATFITSAIWGAGTYYFLEHVDIKDQMLISFMLGGLAAGAASSLAIDRISTISFVIPVLFALAIHFFRSNDPTLWQMGLMTTLYFLFVIATSRIYNKMMLENTHLRHEAIISEHQVALFKQVVDLFPDDVYINKNLDPKFSYANRTASERLGYSRDELIGGMSIFDINPEVTQHDWNKFTSNIKNSKAILIETRHQHRDGHSFPVEITTNSFQFDDQIYTVSTARDITKRKKILNELSQHRYNLERLVRERTFELEIAKNEAIAASNAKTEFLSTMSHELRTPLNAILGFSQLHAFDDNLDEDQQSSLRLINESGQHLLELINQILDMNRIEKGALVFEITVFNISKIVLEIIEMLSNRADEKNITVTTNAKDTIHYVKADPLRVKQVGLNLLNNAIKFTDTGSISINIEAKDDKVYVHFSDTGCGINPTDAERVFLPFEQVKSKQSASGSGLGLAISKQYIEQMDGELILESTPDKGSTFTISLPLVSQLQ